MEKDLGCSCVSVNVFIQKRTIICCFGQLMDFLWFISCNFKEKMILNLKFLNSCHSICIFIKSGLYTCIYLWISFNVLNYPWPKLRCYNVAYSMVLLLTTWKTWHISAPTFKINYVNMQEIMST